VKKTPNPRAEDVALYALTYVRLGKASEAIEVLGKYAHLLNTYSEIRYVYALAYFKLGKIDDAKRYFDWDKTINEKDKFLYFILTQFYNIC
jgi:predicted Zn-dependent protease